MKELSQSLIDYCVSNGLNFQFGASFEALLTALEAQEGEFILFMYPEYITPDLQDGYDLEMCKSEVSGTLELAIYESVQNIYNVTAVRDNIKACKNKALKMFTALQADCNNGVTVESLKINPLVKEDGYILTGVNIRYSVTIK